MPRFLRISLIAAAIPIVLVVWVSAVFALDRASNDGEVLGRVTVDGLPLSGLDVADARQAMLEIEEALATEPINVIVQDTTFTLLPRSVGYDIDEELVIEQAMKHGRDGGFMSELRWWLTSFGDDPTDLSYAPTYNRDALMNLLMGWELQAINDPPTEGGIRVEEGVVVAVYAESGTGLASSKAVGLARLFPNNAVSFVPSGNMVQRLCM